MYKFTPSDFSDLHSTPSKVIDNPIMTPQMPKPMNQTATPKNTKASTGAGVVKRRYQKIRFHENGLINVERKAGKYPKMSATKPDRCTVLD
jgi:hypothetical protein